MNIGEWLRSLNLGRYEEAFRDNEIDEQILTKLTAEDLKEIGVGPVGHRRKLLEAIAALSPRGPQPDMPEATAATPPDIVSAERRQLTVMFCDLVNSTELATRHDPEDLRAIIAAYHGAVAEEMARFGGFVAKFMGDGVLTYFGYPQAHEEDTERAVRAAMAVVKAVAGLDLPAVMAVRIGIATGLVVVGDLIGAGSAQEQSVVGETPNLAARLQSLAGANEIVVAHATRRQIGSLFELRDGGSVALRGFAAPQQVWQVVGESDIASRFEALRSRATPLVGRDEEVELLLRRWTQAKGGEGRAVLLSAEAGIGKSRLAEALAECVAGEPRVRLRYFCSPHHQDSAFYPIIARLERAAEFARDDSIEVKRHKLADLLADSPADERSLIAELLSLPRAAADGEPELTPQRRKEKTFAALIGGLERLSRKQPVLMVFEDVHWIDPTSRELLDHILAAIERLPVLLLVTFRPEFQPPWTGLPHVTLLALNRLGRHEGAVLVRQVAGNSPLPPDLVEEVVKCTDGVPLFLEEVTKTLLETAGGPGSSQARSTLAVIPGARLVVPPTLQPSLLARLDRLGPAAKDVAQSGAAIGREFSYALLCAAARCSDAETQAALAQLVAAGLLFQSGEPPTAQYQFKHALMQDTAYGTLLRGPRQALHGRIAEAIEAQTPERVEREPEILAYHLAEAGAAQRAALYWRKAGEQAVRRGGNREAVSHFRRALALVEAQPDGAERCRVELMILSQLTPPTMNVYGRASEEAGEVVERAAAIGRRLDSSPEIAPMIANLWLFNMGRRRFDRAEEIAGDLFRMARSFDDNDIMLQAYHCDYPVRFARGRFRAALGPIEAIAALYDRERHAHHRHIYLGHDPYVCSMAFAANTRLALGYPEHACRVALDTVEFARSLHHAPSLAHALLFTARVFTDRNEPGAVMSVASEIIDLAEEDGLPQARAGGLGYLGWALARSGQVADCLARLTESQQIRDRIASVGQFEAFASGIRAEALLMVGRYAEGLAQVERTLAMMADGERSGLSRLHRTRALLLLHQRGAADPEVEANLKEALAIAREQDAKGWEIGAATDLARLWAEQGRRAEAHDLLAPVYAWFTEGFDTADLKEARALLASLE